ncbi:MAG: ndvC [Fibrobacteres bacterium]|nr:ndvC [Fibrobacterota bacterium]
MGKGVSVLKSPFFRAAAIAALAAVCLVPSLSAKALEYICYSPYRDGQQPGGAEPTEAQIREDFKILAPLVKGIRTYASDGIHAQIPKLALEAGLEVHMGAWIGKDENANQAQVNALIALAKGPSAAAIKGLIVGNEVLLRQDVTKARLIEYIKMVKNAGTGIPVTTADIYQRIGDNSADLAPVVDYVLCHVHPYWENQSAENGAAHVLKGWNLVKAKYPGKRVIVGETGFPSAGQSRSPAIPSEAAQARFTEDLIKVGAANGMSFMLFTSFDEAWKGAEGPVGANWGIWRTNRTEKPAVAKVRLYGTAIALPGRTRGIRAGATEEALGADAVDASGRMRKGTAVFSWIPEAGASRR